MLHIVAHPVEPAPASVPLVPGPWPNRAGVVRVAARANCVPDTQGVRTPQAEVPTARGFEPLRAEPNGFLVHHLSHSVTLSMAHGSCCAVRDCAFGAEAVLRHLRSAARMRVVADVRAYTRTPIAAHAHTDAHGTACATGATVARYPQLLAAVLRVRAEPNLMASRALARAADAPPSKLYDGAHLHRGPRR